MHVLVGSRFVATGLLCVAFSNGAGQRPGDSHPEAILHSQAKLLKAPGAEYPPLARAARVAGEVHLHLMVRKDGTVESADVVDGPAMLRPASIAGARTVLFDCTMCAEQSTPYELTMRFQIVPTIPPKNCEEPIPQSQIEVDSLEHVITVSTPEVWTCDPVVTPAIVLYHVRAARCMYLWRCVWRSKR